MHFAFTEEQEELRSQAHGFLGEFSAPEQVREAMESEMGYDPDLWGRISAELGWTSVVILILIFGGVQLMSLGMVSEYVGRTYEEVKRRPRYVIESMSGIDRS